MAFDKISEIIVKNGKATREIPKERLVLMLSGVSNRLSEVAQQVTDLAAEKIDLEAKKIKLEGLIAQLS